METTSRPRLHHLAASPERVQLPALSSAREPLENEEPLSNLHACGIRGDRIHRYCVRLQWSLASMAVPADCTRFGMARQVPWQVPWRVLRVCVGQPSWGTRQRPYRTAAAIWFETYPLLAHVCRKLHLRHSTAQYKGPIRGIGGQWGATGSLTLLGWTPS